MSPMLTRINETRHDTAISIACGIVFACLTVAFFI